MCPMHKMNNGIVKTSDTSNLVFIRASSRTWISSIFPASCAIFCRAPYPAFVTAWIISRGVTDASSYSTVILFLSKLTSAFATPPMPDTHFCTRLEQAAQLMPVTSKTSFFIFQLLSEMQCAVQIPFGKNLAIIQKSGSSGLLMIYYSILLMRISLNGKAILP